MELPRDPVVGAALEGQGDCDFFLEALMSPSQMAAFESEAHTYMQTLPASANFLETPDRMFGCSAPNSDLSNVNAIAEV